MKTEQDRWTEKTNWENGLAAKLGDSAQLVLLFGATQVLKEKARFEEIKKVYPRRDLRCSCI
jgi:hypothetical protein